MPPRSSLSVHRNGPVRVGLQISTEYAHGRNILRGIIRYNDEHGQWAFWWDRLFHKDFHRSHPMEAMIAEVRDPARVAMLRRLRMPVVAVTGQAAMNRLPLVTADNAAIGRAAAAHFQELGLEHWTYLGNPSDTVDPRREGFCQAAAELGMPVRFCPHPGWLWQPAAKQQSLLRNWVRQLPRPTGVFCRFDIEASALAIFCYKEKIRVPEELAILGVGNDEFFCHLSHPPLSSIDPNAFEMGYQAADLLERLLRGEISGTPTIALPPLPVVRRQSTDILASGDQEMARSLRIIREQACDGLRAEDVAGQINTSRTRLEGIFQRRLGRSVHQEIIRVRMERACHLLRNTTMAMPEITVRCGVSYPSQLSHLFRRHFGISPSEYRQRKGLLSRDEPAVEADNPPVQEKKRGR